MSSRSLLPTLFVVLLAACPDDGATTPAGDASDAIDAGDADTTPDAAEPGITFPAPGPIAGEAGRGSFAFGVATAATQIEDANPDTDWWAWTAPKPEGLGNGAAPVGDAVMGFTRAVDDVALIAAMNLDVYRFNVSWARVEPQRDLVDEAALAHYDAVIDALVDAGIRPMITVHHFSNPVWAGDPRGDCAAGPTDDDLCGLDHPVGGDEVVAELAEHAALLAQRYGDRVDDWTTLNEPVNYLVASYGVGQFPPGRALLFSDPDAFIDTFRRYVAAHVAVYDAIKANDTIDADNDGVAAQVGFTLSVADWVPARDNAPSSNPEDVAAAERVRYVYHHVFVDSLVQGGFDADLDGTLEESHPDWAGKLDWLGVQYYFRAGVSGADAVLPVVDAVICFLPLLDLGACLPPEDPTWWVPTMRYEFYAPALGDLLIEFSERWPDLPMTVTESGIATEVGRRRAEHVVRSLEQIQRAIDAGADVRGYYHWSLMDNFEWAEGYEPRFGLYRVDLGTFERTATEGATVLGAIAADRRVTDEQLQQYGGNGPMTPEPEPAAP